MGAYEHHALMKQCKGCGATFMTNYYDREYHSVQCKDKASKRRQRLRSKHEPADVGEVNSNLRLAAEAERQLRQHGVAGGPAEARRFAYLQSIKHLPKDEVADKLAAYDLADRMRSDESESAIALFRQGKLGETDAGGPVADRAGEPGRTSTEPPRQSSDATSGDDPA